MEDSTSGGPAWPSTSDLATETAVLDHFASSISAVDWLDPTDEELQTLESAALALEAETEVVDAEAALMGAIDRLAAARASVLYLAYLGWTTEGLAS